MKFTLILSLILFLSYAEAAPLPAALFFNYPDVIHVSLSPSGKWIAKLRIVDGDQVLSLVNAQSLNEHLLLNLKDYSEKDSAISRLVWIDDRHIATQLTEIGDGIDDLVSTKVTKRLLIVDSQKKEEGGVYSVRTKGWLVNPLPNSDLNFLYAKTGTTSRVYRLDVSKLALDNKKLGKTDRIDGGQFTKSNEVKGIAGYALRWFFTGEDSPSSVLYVSKEQRLELASFDGDNETKVLESWKVDEDGILGKPDWDMNSFIPIEPGENPNEYYCFNDTDKDKNAIYRVNFIDKKFERIFETEAFSIIDVIVDGNRKFVGVTVLKNGTIDFEYASQSGEKSLPKNGQIMDENNAQISSKMSFSSNGEAYLIYQETFNNPGQYFFVNSATGTKRLVGERHPKLSGKIKSIQMKGRVVVEGLEIPYILNTPTKENGNIRFPLVVLPHGGPIGVFDSEYYDQSTQLLNSNGYAVLRVNFRGSSGHTQMLREGGKKQWGNLMLEDLYQSTMKVANFDFIDKEKICVVGMSYGGYAAAALVLRYPELYKCAVSVAGVMDLPLFINSTNATRDQRKWLMENVGDPRTEYDLLKSISPLYNIGDLTRPIFIVHGKKDQRVDVEHAYRMKLMLEKYNKDFEFFVEPQWEHSFGKPEDATILFDKILMFVKNNV